MFIVIHYIGFLNRFMKEKVLIFINSMQFGGAERVVSAILWNLRHEWDIHLALYSNEIEFDIPPEVTVVHLNQPIQDGFARVFLKMPSLAFKLNRYCKTHQINTSVAFLNRACYINALMRSLCGFKGSIIMSERTHQSTMLAGTGWLYRNISKRMVRFAYKRADHVIANAHAVKTDLIENFGVRAPITVIHNPVDVDFIQGASKEPVDMEFEKDVFHFVVVGGFRKEKNYPLLLEAFSLLKDLRVKLVIVGGGVLEPQVKNLIHQFNLQDRVLMAGIAANPYKYIVRADCMVLSSYVEGFPNVLLEGLACGKPVVSTDCKSGPREILAPQTDPGFQVQHGIECAEFGLLTDPHQATFLAEGMRRMVTDEALRTQYAQQATARARAFDVSQTIAAYGAVFKAKPHVAG